MKQKQMTIVAIACGLVCAACVALFMTGVQGEADSARAEALARYGGEQVEAYVATRDIVAGERVDLSAVETRLWVADLLPENAVRESSDAVGKTATSTIFKGEVITSGRFEVGQDALDVPAGKQAVSVPAKAVQAVGGAIHAGMSVDIYSSGDSSTTAIASNVNVLDTSVGSSGSLVSGENGWITLAVEPGKVQEIIAASNKTTLYFTLPGESAAADSGEAPDANGPQAGEGGSGKDGSDEGEAGRRSGDGDGAAGKSSDSKASDKAEPDSPDEPAGESESEDGDW